VKFEEEVKRKKTKKLIPFKKKKPSFVFKLKA
jgi:hypothetical protein